MNSSGELSLSPVKIGIIGCGDIARRRYVSGVRQFPVLDLIACADLDMKAASRMAADLGMPRSCEISDLLSDDDIELVLNLTPPKAHSAVSLSVLRSGKHVYVEKPFALSRPDARLVLNQASANGLLVAAAPDTFLGAGLQTCRQVMDQGLIGQPTAATAFMAVPGHERWHPNPSFFYKEGGGPLLDMGPYYLTALVALLGPIARVSGLAKTTYPERTITSQPQYGHKIQVEVNTHLSASLEFKSGVIGTAIMSFDVHKHSLPSLEIYGTEGALSLPDPNTFEGPVRLYRPQQAEPAWKDVPLNSPYTGHHRGIGVADLASAIRRGRVHRATGEQAAHVLDAMLAIEESAASGTAIELQTSIHRPDPLPTGLSLGELD